MKRSGAMWETLSNAFVESEKASILLFFTVLLCCENSVLCALDAFLTPRCLSSRSIPVAVFPKKCLVSLFRD